jgi:hypothetical protein
MHYTSHSRAHKLKSATGLSSSSEGCEEEQTGKNFITYRGYIWGLEYCRKGLSTDTSY